MADTVLAIPLPNSQDERATAEQLAAATAPTLST